MTNNLKTLIQSYANGDGGETLSKSYKDRLTTVFTILINDFPNITSVQDAGANVTPFTLDTTGIPTIITVTASDPEELPLTYSYSLTAGSLTNGGGTTATVVQGTGANINQFTITPSTTVEYAGTFELTFTASDGINTATSPNIFILTF